MSDYRPLAPVQVNAAADNTGKNTGNWTNAFTSQQLPSVNIFEIYHMVVTGGPPFASANIVIAGRQWSYVQLDINGGNEWDPSEPALMIRDQELYFFWQVAAVAPAPMVTIWPRFDTQLPENAYVGR
jgi:hypothetical protein